MRASTLLSAALPALLASVSPAQERVYLLGAEATDGDDFGRAVADAGDVDQDGVPDVIVGSPNDDVNGTSSGSVFVYSGRTGELLWTRAGEDAGDRLGWAVDGLGDINGDGHSDVIVGAPGWDNDGVWAANSGSVLVLSGNGGFPLIQWMFNSLNAQLGYEVRGLGDLNGDGIREFAYSIPWHDSNGHTDNGFVFFYHGASQNPMFSRSGDEDGAMYGYSIDTVAAPGILAHARVIIGEPGVDGAGTDRGRARIIDGFGTTQATIVGSTDHEWLGASVAGVGDVNGDGSLDWAAGSPYADVLGVGTDAGLVRVYSGASGGFLYSVAGATASANLGQSLAGIGDFDGDGRDDFLVGAPNDDSGTNDGGEARVVSGFTGFTLESWTGGVSDHMGRAVRSAGDLNGDGLGDVVIGANDAPFGAGQAYVHLAGLDAPDVYCTAKPNSQGCVPQVSTQGVASLSIANGFVVTASNVLNNKFGLLFWGHGADSVPFMGGTLCVSSPLVRTAVQFSGGNAPPDDCTGSFSFHFSHAYMASKSFQPGDRIHAQYWYRDPASSFTVGLTNAVAFDVVP